MDGFAMLIRSALGAFGVQIDPEEITATVETAKVLIPEIAARFKTIDERLQRIEDMLVAQQPGNQPESTVYLCRRCGVAINGVGHCDDCKTKLLE